MTKEEREKAIKFIHAYMHPTNTSEFEQKKLLYRDMAIEALEQQGKIGKWETTTTVFCGRTFEVIECSCCKQKQDWYAKTDYCPNCGAKMEVSE